MNECRAVDVDKAAISIFAALTMGRAKPGLVKEAGESYQRLKPTLNLDAMTFCLGKYITAELDSDTPGERGLGRLTADTPRLGGHCRNSMSKLSKAERGELCRLIQDLMLRGYLVNGVIVQKGRASSEIADPEVLYEKWIPGIYSSDISEMGENLREVLAVCSQEAFESVNGFLAARRIKGGGLLSANKVDTILFYYPLAGYGLRTVETRGF